LVGESPRLGNYGVHSDRGENENGSR
jgi:hypothetical protein